MLLLKKIQCQLVSMLVSLVLKDNHWKNGISIKPGLTTNISKLPSDLKKWLGSMIIILTHHTKLLANKYRDNIDIFYYTGKREELRDIFAKTLCMKNIDWSKVKAGGVSLFIAVHVCCCKDINNN